MLSHANSSSKTFTFKLSTKVHNPPHTVRYSLCFLCLTAWAESAWPLLQPFGGFWGGKLSLLGRNSQKGLLSWSRVCRTSLFRLTLGCWELKHLVVELVILSKKTESPDKMPRRNTSWTTTYKISCQSKLNTFSVRLPIPFSMEASLRTVLWWFQAWKSSWHNIVNDILLTENIPHLESTVANWHLDPGTQLWAGTSPQSSQSPHWVETLWWWWWFKDILGISITPRFSKASSNWQGKKLSGPRADYYRCAFEWM